MVFYSSTAANATICGDSHLLNRLGLNSYAYQGTNLLRNKSGEKKNRLCLVDKRSQQDWEEAISLHLELKTPQWWDHWRHHVVLSNAFGIPIWQLA